VPEDLTHAVTVTVFGLYDRGPEEHVSVTIRGDGGLTHMVDAFRAALIAVGFSPAQVDDCCQVSDLDVMRSVGFETVKTGR